VADYEDKPREHEFDGIVEYDNRVPGWPQGFFHITVVFAVVYLAWFWMGPGKLGAERYEEERIEILRKLTANMTELPDEETLRQLSHDQQRIAAGKELFFGRGGCVQCHGQDGLGMHGVGPNLRDDRWLHGSGMTDIINTLEQGSPTGQMQSQSAILSRDQMISVAAWIADWNRTQKANGKGETKGDRETVQPIDY